MGQSAQEEHQVLRIAWAALERALEILRLSALKRLPSLHVLSTLEELQKVGKGNVFRYLEPLDPGLRRCFITLLRDGLKGVELTLLLLAERIEGTALEDLEKLQIGLRRQEQKCSVVSRLFHHLKNEANGDWDTALKEWKPWEVFSLGDMAAFWEESFPGPLQIRPTVFSLVVLLQAGKIRSAALGVPEDESGTSESRSVAEELTTWLAPDAEGRTSIAEVARVFDYAGLWRGMLTCTAWEELCGHALISAVSIAGDAGGKQGGSPGKIRGGRSSGMSGITAQDLVLERKERLQSVFLPQWSRAHLARCRTLLHALGVLGMRLCCDIPASGSGQSGLLVQFHDAETASQLLWCQGKTSDGLASAVQECVTEPWAIALQEHVQDADDASTAPDSSSFPTGIIFAPIEQAQTPSVLAATRFTERLLKPAARGSAGAARTRDQHLALQNLRARKLLELGDNLRQMEVLQRRRMEVVRERFLARDPTLRSPAWPKHQRARAEQIALEKAVITRKADLLQMEQESGHPEQIAHVRALLQDVALAEDEQEQNRRYLQQMEQSWIEEEREHQLKRHRRDEAMRQKIHVMTLEAVVLENDRRRARAERIRTEESLLDLEETFSRYRSRVHAYDEELTGMISEKEALLAALTSALAQAKDKKKQLEVQEIERTKDLDVMQSILQLQDRKLALQAQVFVVQKKTERVMAKTKKMKLDAL